MTRIPNSADARSLGLPPLAVDRVSMTKALALFGGLWLAFVGLGALGAGRQWATASWFGLAFVTVGLLVWRLLGGHRWELYLLLFLVGLSLFRIGYVVAVPNELSGDEALYWDCSRKLDWCYVTVGPGVAICIWCTRMLLGNTELGVRAAAIVLSFASSLVLYFLGRRLYDRKVGVLSAAMLQVTPVYAFYGIGMTTDPLLIFLWLLSLLLVHRAWRSGAPLDWALLGLAVGLGLLAKYNMAIFLLPAFLLLLLSPARRQLLTAWPYLGFALCMAVVSPAVVWNARHGWVNIYHNLGHIHLEQGLQVSLGSFAEFVGSQLGIVTPLLLPMMIWASVKQRKRNPLCFWFFLLPLALFLLKSLQGRVLANWALCCYLAPLVSFTAYFLVRRHELNVHVRRLTDAAVVVAILGTIALPMVPLLTFPPHLDPLGKFRRGSVQLGHDVARFCRELKTQRFVFSDHYMTAALLGFYVDGQPNTYCVDLGRRINEFDMWPTFHNLVHYDAILVLHGDTDMPQRLRDRFTSYRKRLVKARSLVGSVENTYSVFLCRDFQGMVRVIPTRYN
jgi:hypothetical protein